MAAALPATATTALDVAITGRASHVIQAVLAMFLGVLIVGMAGLSHIDAVHNAAHDTRHSTGFPCH